MFKKAHHYLSAYKHTQLSQKRLGAPVLVRAMLLTVVRSLRQPGVHYRLALLLATLLAFRLIGAWSQSMQSGTISHVWRSVQFS